MNEAVPSIFDHDMNNCLALQWQHDPDDEDCLCEECDYRYIVEPLCFVEDYNWE